MSERPAKEKKYDVMVAGHLCLDMFPSFGDTSAETVGELFRPGGLVNANELCFSTGGTVSNTGIAMRKLGNRVRLCSCVGDDHLGKLTVELIEKYVKADGIRVVNGAGSSYTIVLAPSSNGSLPIPQVPNFCSRSRIVKSAFSICAIKPKGLRSSPVSSISSGQACPSSMTIAWQEWSCLAPYTLPRCRKI